MRAPLMLMSLFAMTCENAIVPIDQGDAAAATDSGGLDGDSGALGDSSCVVASLATGAWSQPFEANTSCTCVDSGPMCHALYDAQVVGVEGRTATLRFRKWDESPAQATFRWWLGDFGVVVPQCDTLAAPVVLAEGQWPAESTTLDIEVELWSTDEINSGAPPDRRVSLVSGGQGNIEDRVWFQPFAVEFRWDCSAR
jgi:hypothetical protein